MSNTLSARARGLVRVVHPFPSLLNAGLVGGLAVLAGGAPATAGLLAVGMLGLQFAIGAFNDVCDAQLDRLTKPSKPIPAGQVRLPEAILIGVACGATGLAAALAVGIVPALLAAAMLAAGLAYDAWLKVRGVGWLAFAIAFPLLPAYAWLGAAGELPPRSELLLPLAALGGPMLQLANGLTDLERDARAGLVGLAGRLGRPTAVALLAVLQLIVNGVAWLSALGMASAAPAAIVLLGAASVLSAIGVALSSSAHPAARQWGWHGQAIGLALLAGAWLALAVRAGQG